MDFYWKITERDNTVTYIRPSDVATVKRRMDNGQPIHTTNRSIPASQIASFTKSDKPTDQQLLLEGAARAFNEPLLEDGAVVCKWVCKPVTQQEFNRSYAQFPAYHFLSEMDGMVDVAFRVPVHQIDYHKVRECNVDEIARLTRN
jgi:hypothetical protein